MARVAINTGAAANDGTGDSLRSAGGIINSNFLEIYNYLGTGTTLNAPIWSSTSAGINTLSNVGVGTTNPRFALEVGAVGSSGTSLWVNGDARITGILTIGTASVTINGSTNTINVGSGITINGSTGAINASSINLGGTVLSGAGVTYITAGSGISVDQNTGNVTITATGGGGGGGGESYWSQNSTGINTTSNVGIGTTTASSALTVKGDTSLETLSVSGISTFSGDIKFSGTYGDNGALWDESEGALIFKDGRQIRLGDYDGSGGDLRIYHATDGSHSYIQDTGTGNLRIISGGDAIELLKDTTETMAKFNTDGSVELYYDNSKKFETLGAGVTVTGTTFTNQLSVSGVSTLGTVQISSGIITASSGIVTYYGDASNAADGRWTLGANGTSDYTFTGIGFTQTTNDPVLYLTRGEVYEFVNNSGGAHPFQIRLSNGGSAYNNGVTNNGAASGTIRFEVPFDAPNTLYYQCTSHSGMGSTIYVTPRTEPAVGVRTTLQYTTSSVGAAATVTFDDSGFKSYGLLKVGISSAAWLRLYVDSASRTSDESRIQGVDPSPDAGVIAEIISTGSTTVLMSPGVIGWNNDSPTTSTIYGRVTNNGSSTASSGIGITLTVVKLED